MTEETIRLHFVTLIVAVVIVAIKRNDASTNVGWINVDSLKNSRTAWYETVDSSVENHCCPPLPMVRNARLVYGHASSSSLSSSSSPTAALEEGTVGTYVCDTRYKISSEYNTDAHGLQHHAVKFACVPEFITFNMGSRRLNVSYVCSKSPDNKGHGQWILLRGQNPFHENNDNYDDDDDDRGKQQKQLTGDWRQTKINHFGGRSYPTSVIYNTWSLRPDSDAIGVHRTWWIRLGRTVEDRFLVLIKCFTILVMLLFVLRGIFRTFCVTDWTPPQPQPQPPFNDDVSIQCDQRLQPSAGTNGNVNNIMQTQMRSLRVDDELHLLPIRWNHHHHHHLLHHHSANDFSLIILPVRKDSCSVDTSTALPSYAEATGLPSYDDIIIETETETESEDHRVAK